MLAVVLQVHPLPGSIGGNQDPQRLLIGIGVELGLQSLAVVFTHATGERSDAAIGIGVTKQLPQLRFQIALGVDVVGKDQQSGGLPRRLGLPEVGAEVSPKKLLQQLDAGIRPVAVGCRDLAHPLQQGQIALISLNGLA